MKKLVLIILVLSIVVFVILQTSFVKKLLTGKNISNDKLSDRSKNFIEKQKKENPLWNNADLTKKGPQEASIIDIDGCFTITVPFKIVVTRKDDICNFHILVDRPKANIIAYTLPFHQSSLDDEPGVNFRRNKKDVYDEYSQKIGDRTFLIFKRKGGTFERNAFFVHNASLLVVNIKALTSKDLTKDFHAMLNSVQFTQDNQNGTKNGATN